MLRFWVLREMNSPFCSKTQWQMFSVGFRSPCWCPSMWAPSWRLHTNLYKFGKNVSPHIFHKKNCSDLNLGEGLCISTFFLFPDSGLNLLNGFDFLFWSILNGVTLKTSNCEQSKPYFEPLTTAWQRCLLQREYFDFVCLRFHWVFLLCLAIRCFCERRSLKSAVLSFLNFLFSLIRRSEFFIDNFRDQVKRFRSTVV